MPAKLSRLQRNVLEIALANAIEDRPTSLREVVGLVLDRGTVPDPHLEKRAHVFRKSDPGYEAAMASASRAVRRLEKRGLVYRHGIVKGCALFALTTDGAKLAEGLTVSVVRPGSASEKRGRNKKRRKLLVKEQPSFLKPKRLTHDDLKAAKDVEWRPIP